MATNILYFFACLCLCQANPLYPAPCEISNGIKPCDKSPSFNLGPYGLLGPLGLGMNNGPLGPNVIETPHVYNGFNGYNGYTLGVNANSNNVIETMPPISVEMDLGRLSRLLGTPVVEAVPALSYNIPKGLGGNPLYEAAIGVGSLGYGPVYETPAIPIGNFAPIYEPVLGIGGLGYGFSNVAPIYEPTYPVGYGVSNVGPVYEPALGYGIGNIGPMFETVAPMYEAPVWPNFGGMGYGVGNVGPVFETPMAVGGFGLNNVAPVYEAPVWPNFGGMGSGVGNVGPVFETPMAVGGFGLNNVAPVYETPVWPNFGGMGYGVGNVGPVFETPMAVGGFGLKAPVYEAPVWPSFGGYGIGNVGPIFDTPVPVGYGISNVSPVYETSAMGFGSVGYGLGGLHPYSGLGKPIF